MADTLLLDRKAWDLCLDASGNIAMASDPYSMAQDVASAVRLFLGELWYDTTKGMPYWSQILGKRPPLSLVKAEVVKAAMTVPGVADARCLIASFRDRAITGQVQFRVARAGGQTPGSLSNRGRIINFKGDPLITFDGYYMVSF